MKYQHRVLGMLSLLAVITYLDRVCIAVAVGDWMVKRHGLRNARRWLGVAGLSVAARSLAS
jgi:hypothetical protein